MDGSSEAYRLLEWPCIEVCYGRIEQKTRIDITLSKTELKGIFPCHQAVWGKIRVVLGRLKSLRSPSMKNMATSIVETVTDYLDE